jgi:hypothetical protein
MILLVLLVVLFLAVGGYVIYLKMRPEVYHARWNYGISSTADMKSVADAFGAKLATADQLEAAFQKGAEWCSAGWVDNGGKLAARWPMQTVSSNCGIKSSKNDLGASATAAGITLYGPKPAKNSELAIKGDIWAFNGSKWSMYD